MAQRLFIGGLPPDTTPEELTARFAPLGQVLDCQVAAPKRYGSAVFPRCFGFVELEPKDDKALAKALAAYNGANWRGSVLKCHPARLRHQQRLQEEWQKDTAELKDGDETKPQLQQREPLQPGSTLHLAPARIFEERVTVQLGSGAKLTTFPDPPAQQQPCSWEPLEPPPNAKYTFEQRLLRLAESAPKRPAGGEAGAAGGAVPHASSPQSSGDEPRTRKASAAAAAAAATAYAARQLRLQANATSRQQPKPAPQQEQRRLRVVEFEDQPHEQLLAAKRARTGAADLSRFGSDSDAEGGEPALQLRQPAQRTHKAAQQQVQAARPSNPAAEPQSSSGGGSSSSSGGSELEEWLAQEAAAAAEVAPHLPGGSEQPTSSSGGTSSGGSELEEWLAQEAEGGMHSPLSSTPSSPRQQQQEGEEQQHQQQDGAEPLQQQQQQARPKGAAEQAAAGLLQQQPSPPQQQQQPKPVAELLSAAEAQQLARRRSRAVDLARFGSSSSDSEDAGAAGPRLAAAPRPFIRKGRAMQRQIPQADGGNDTSSSDSGSASISGDSSSSEGEEEEVGEEGQGEGGDTTSSDSEGAPSEGTAAEAPAPPAAAAPAPQPGGSITRRQQQDQAQQEQHAEEQRQLAALAAVLPLGAAYVRQEPAEQAEAVWRVSKAAWMQDFRQKARQAARQKGGGHAGGKRQRQK